MFGCGGTPPGAETEDKTIIDILFSPTAIEIKTDISTHVRRLPLAEEAAFVPSAVVAAAVLVVAVTADQWAVLQQGVVHPVDLDREDIAQPVVLDTADIDSELVVHLDTAGIVPVEEPVVLGTAGIDLGTEDTVQEQVQDVPDTRDTGQEPVVLLDTGDSLAPAVLGTEDIVPAELRVVLDREGIGLAEELPVVLDKGGIAQVVGVLDSPEDLQLRGKKDRANHRIIQ